jgi:hypothetical protein
MAFSEARSDKLQFVVVADVQAVDNLKVVGHRAINDLPTISRR